MLIGALMPGSICPATAADGTVVGEEPSALGERIRQEEQAQKASRFFIRPHKPTYFLVTYNSNPNSKPYQEEFPQFADQTLSDWEVKFQFSMKVPIWENIGGTRTDLFAAYSQLSLWQAFLNKDEISAPFRESNYEPEIFVTFRDNFKLLGFTNRTISISFDHQSNGMGGSLSRSWNRIIGIMSFDKGNFAFAVRGWYRMPEDEEDDDNPAMEKYYGYGELYAYYKIKDHLVGGTFRNNLRSENKGAIQLDWTFPLTKYFRGYVQYFNGYGESLIDYNHSNNRIGLGVLLSDWF
jgi:phospholipase A1